MVLTLNFGQPLHSLQGYCLIGSQNRLNGRFREYSVENAPGIWATVTVKPGVFPL